MERPTAEIMSGAQPRCAKTTKCKCRVQIGLLEARKKEIVPAMSVGETRVTVSVEELIVSLSLQVTALVELLEERRILTGEDVMERMKQIRDRKKPS